MISSTFFLLLSPLINSIPRGLTNLCGTRQQRDLSAAAQGLAVFPLWSSGPGEELKSWLLCSGVASRATAAGGGARDPSGGERAGSDGEERLCFCFCRVNAETSLGVEVEREGATRRVRRMVTSPRVSLGGQTSLWVEESHLVWKTRAEGPRGSVSIRKRLSLPPYHVK